MGEKCCPDRKPHSSPRGKAIAPPLPTGLGEAARGRAADARGLPTAGAPRQAARVSGVGGRALSQGRHIPCPSSHILGPPLPSPAHAPAHPLGKKGNLPVPECAHRVATLMGIVGKGRYPCPQGLGVGRRRKGGLGARGPGPCLRIALCLAPAAFSSSRVPSGAAKEKFTRRRDRGGKYRAAKSGPAALALKDARQAADSGVHHLPTALDCSSSRCQGYRTSGHSFPGQYVRHQGPP